MEKQFEELKFTVKEAQEAGDEMVKRLVRFGNTLGVEGKIAEDIVIKKEFGCGLYVKVRVTKKKF